MSDNTRQRPTDPKAPAAPIEGLEYLSAFAPLSPVTSAETAVTPDLIQFNPASEGLVRLIENVPQERSMELLVEQLRLGTPYRQLLAGLFLAALRRPATLAHSVFMIHSSHELSLAAPPEERLLPLFWAMTNFKYWQEWHRETPDRLPIPAGPVPPMEDARRLFHAAMEEEDGESAQRAIISILRSNGVETVKEMLWLYAAKDCVRIGHNAIAVANSWRALPTIGEQHIEPMLCWLVLPLMGRGDQWYPANRERVARTAERLPAGWEGRSGGPSMTIHLLRLMRELQTDAACTYAASALQAGETGAGAIWDAIHLHAGELMMRKADVGHPLHANTAANALHFAFRNARSPETRLLILLQAIAWQCQSRRRKMETDEEFRTKDLEIDLFGGSSISHDPHQTTNEILSLVETRPEKAAEKAFTLAEQHPNSTIFQRTACRLLPTRATPDAHDIKFPVSIFEDYEWVHPRWKPHLLAASVYWLQGSDKPESPSMQQAREAVRTLQFVI